MGTENQDLTMEQLKGIISEVVKTEGKAGLDALREEIKQTQRAAIFPGSDDRYLESTGKTVIDTSFFQKDYSQGGRAHLDPVMAGKDLGRQLAIQGGPFKSLSPQMEKFAQVIRAGGDPYRLGPQGLDIKAYNEEIRQYNLGQTKDTATGLTTTDVGALVPVEYLATVVEFATAQSRILSLLWRIPMGSLSMKIPKLVQAAGSYFGGLTLYHPDEAVQKTETKPSFDTLTFTAKKLIGIIPMSDEVIADSSINLINYITGLFVRAFQYQTEGEVIAGTGLLGQMLGILNDPGINLVGRTTLGTVKYDDVVNLESEIDENFQNLTFLSRRATFNTLRKQKDSSGQPLYHEPFASMYGGAAPPQLLGYPCIKTRNVPALGLTGDIILGDLGFYIWAIRQEMTIDTSRDARFFYDQTVIRFVVRQDGAPGVPPAFSVLTSTPAS